MAKYDVVLRVDPRLNYGSRHIFLQTFDTLEEAEALCRSIERYFLKCDDLQCKNRIPCYEACEALPWLIITREED